MALPEKMRALKNTGPGTIAIQQVPIPTVHDDWILVKIKYVALNPTDWQATNPSPNTTSHQLTTV